MEKGADKSRARLGGIASCIVVSLTVCGYLEERIFQHWPGFRFPEFFTLFECIGFAVFSYAHLVHRSKGHTVRMTTGIPQVVYALLAMIMFMDRMLNNVALKLLNYPTVLVLKSTKLPIVMLVGILLQRKHFSRHKYTSACLLAASAFLFSLGDQQVTPEYDWIGFLAICSSVLLDAFYVNVSEMLLQRKKPHLTELLFHQNLYASGIATLLWVYSSTVGEVYEFVLHHPVIWFILVFRICAIYVGAYCIVLLLKEYGAVTTTCVTTLRKILSLSLSFLLYPKPVSMNHVLALMLFILAVSIGVRTTT